MKKPKELQQLVTIHTLHTPAILGFSSLFFTFAMSTQGYALGAGTIGLSAAVAMICVLCAALEFYNAFKDNKKTNYKKASHALNISAFLFAAVGCSLVTAELTGASMTKWAAVLPAAFFVATTTLFAISFLIQSVSKNKSDERVKNRLFSFLFFIQALGASFLLTSAFQENGISKPLSHVGKNGITILHTAIASTAVIAGLTALGCLILNARTFYEKLKTTLESPDNHILHTMAAFGFASLFIMFALANQGYSIGAAGIILSLVVATTCIACLANEARQEQSSKASMLGFLFAAVGSVFAAVELFGVHFSSGMKLAPSACFIVTTALLAFAAGYKALKDNQFNKKALDDNRNDEDEQSSALIKPQSVKPPHRNVGMSIAKCILFGVQFAGAGILLLNGLQQEGYMHLCSQHGISLATTIITSFAAAAALATISLGKKATNNEIETSCKENLNAVSL